MRSVIFRAFTQRVVAILYRRFGTTYRFNLQAPKNPGSDHWKVAGLLVACAETSVRNYHYKLGNMAAERRSQVTCPTPTLTVAHPLNKSSRSSPVVCRNVRLPSVLIHTHLYPFLQGCILILPFFCSLRSVAAFMTKFWTCCSSVLRASFLTYVTNNVARFTARRDGSRWQKSRSLNNSPLFTQITQFPESDCSKFVQSRKFFFFRHRTWCRRPSDSAAWSALVRYKRRGTSRTNTVPAELTETGCLRPATTSALTLSASPALT